MVYLCWEEKVISLRIGIQMKTMSRFKRKTYFFLSGSKATENSSSGKKKAKNK